MRLLPLLTEPNLLLLLLPHPLSQARALPNAAARRAAAVVGKLEARQPPMSWLLSYIRVVARAYVLAVVEWVSG